MTIRTRRTTYVDPGSRCSHPEQLAEVLGLPASTFEERRSRAYWPGLLAEVRELKEGQKA